MTDPVTRRMTPLEWPDMPPVSLPGTYPQKKDDSYYKSSIASLGEEKKSEKTKAAPTDWFSSVATWFRGMVYGAETDQKPVAALASGELPKTPQLTPPSSASRVSAFQEKALKLRKELNQTLENMNQEDDTLVPLDTANGDYLRTLFNLCMVHKAQKEDASKVQYKLIDHFKQMKNSLHTQIVSLEENLRSQARSVNVLGWIEKGTGVVIAGVVALKYLTGKTLPALKPDSAINTYLLLIGATSKTAKSYLDYKGADLEGKRSVTSVQAEHAEKKVSEGMDYLVQFQEELGRLLRCIRSHLNNHHQAVIESIRSK